MSKTLYAFCIRDVLVTQDSNDKQFSSIKQIQDYLQSDSLDSEDGDEVVIFKLTPVLSGTYRPGFVWK